MTFQNLLRQAFREIEDVLQEEDSMRKKEGDYAKPRLELSIVGQAALLLTDAEPVLAEAGKPLIATMEIDAFSNPTTWPRYHEIRNILIRHGIPIDDLSNEIWMPQETVYTAFFPSEEGSDTLFKASIADHEAIIISKAKFKRQKDQAIIDSYVSSSLPTQRFWSMLEKYGIDLA